MERVLHLYSDPMCLGSSYTRLKQYATALTSDYVVDSYFAVMNDVKSVANTKFSADLLDVKEFWDRSYDALLIEGHPQPQSDFCRLPQETALRFHEHGGVIIHFIGVGDLNRGLPTLNEFLHPFYLGIDTFSHEDDDIIGFDRTTCFGHQKEFTIATDNNYMRGRTCFPDLLEGVEAIAVSDPLNQKIDLACRTILMGNTSTQLVSRGEYLVTDRTLEFCRVNELGGFYVLLSAYVLEDFMIRRNVGENLRFGRRLLGHFLALQRQRDAKQGIRLRKCFLSYNHQDQTFAKKLGKNLVKSGIDVWYDKWEISAGESIIGKVEEGLASCNCLLVVMSPRSMKSEWVRIELCAALTRRLSEKSITIIPILLENCEVPALIQDLKYVDFREEFKDPIKFLGAAIMKLPRPYAKESGKRE